MIAKLEAEAEADATEKAFCDKEVPEAQAKVDDKADEIEKITAEMDKIRQEEKATFDENEAELSKGLAGIKKALKVLNDYYSKDAAHGSAGGSSSGIIGLLEVCESDFSKELAELNQNEATAQSEYDTQTKENEVTKTMKEQDVKYKEKEAKGLDKDVSDYSSDRSGVQTELTAVNEYLKELEGRCIAKAESYSERKARRDAEIAGLKEGLQVLENESAFIQVKSKHFMSVRRHQ